MPAHALPLQVPQTIKSEWTEKGNLNTIQLNALRWTITTQQPIITHLRDENRFAPAEAGKKWNPSSSEPAEFTHIRVTGHWPRLSKGMYCQILSAKRACRHSLNRNIGSGRRQPNS